MKTEHTFKADDRVRTINTYEAGVVHRVVETPTGVMCHVFFGHDYGPAPWNWEPVSNLRCVNKTETWGRHHMVQLYGKRYPVCHIDATGHDLANIHVAMRVNRRACRSTYVRHMERVRKTRHRHPVGEQGMFYGKMRYIRQRDANGKRMRSIRIEPTPRPCIIISHDERNSWSGYCDTWYTVQFTDGATRSYVTGSQYRPA